jgi:hypothetical protein
VEHVERDPLEAGRHPMDAQRYSAASHVQRRWKLPGKSTLSLTQRSASRLLSW